MEFDITKVSGIDHYVTEEKQLGEGMNVDKVTVYKPSEDEKAFFVVRKNTYEVRTDGKLAKLLKEKYESVMDSRYFGRGGIEIVASGQMPEAELYDLIRLSYNMTIDSDLVKKEYI